MSGNIAEFGSFNTIILDVGIHKCLNHVGMIIRMELDHFIF